MLDATVNKKITVARCCSWLWCLPATMPWMMCVVLWYVYCTEIMA